ncbi:MAG: cupin domain-containing protein [Candidatus Omnitrophica bacterium]|nr:cupin domain-containing protein [Candidatus Omnitrophota bacterium]
MKKFPSVGPAVRMLRKRRGLTIAQVSRITRIDVATLSRIESGRMSGTVDAHFRIAEALNIRLPDLYESVLSSSPRGASPKSNNFIPDPDAPTASGSELLASDLPGSKMIPLRITLRGNKKTPPTAFDAGSERFVYTLKGALDIVFDSNAVRINTGESLYFNAARTHQFVNPGADNAVFLVVTASG